MARFVRHQYLAVVPHILIALRHITNVPVYRNGGDSGCCGTHLVSLSALLVVGGGGGGGGGAVGSSREIKLFFFEVWATVERAKRQGFPSPARPLYLGQPIEVAFSWWVVPPFKQIRLEPATRALYQRGERAQKLF